ncbi:MAG TPA: O-antigen polymerase [Salinimicrobium sp.]|nr:O-antigen polymerase [Salinimicrobium sp.]
MLNLDDLFVIGVLMFFLIYSAKDGIGYFFISTLVLTINFVGNLMLEENLIVPTNINFALFFLIHIIFFRLFSKYRFVNQKFQPQRFLYFRGKKILWIYFIIALLGGIFFFYQVGLLVFMDNLLEARERLRYGNGIFSRIILHGLPIIAGIFICHYCFQKKIIYLIAPILAIVFILLTGYRGFIIWTLLYFLMVFNNFKKIKIYNWKIWSGSIAIFFFSIFLTQQYYSNLSLQSAMIRFLERIFINNVFGYNILINKYLPLHDISLSEIDNLPSTLFAWNFGGSGKLVQMGAELTVTLPGMSYVLGGYAMTLIFGALIGSISGSLVRLNRLSIDPSHTAIRTFLLFSFVTLINRGYIMNFISIAIVSTVIMYLMFFLPSKKVIRTEYSRG